MPPPGRRRNFTAAHRCLDDTHSTKGWCFLQPNVFHHVILATVQWLNWSCGAANPQMFQSLKGPGPNRSYCNAATWHGYFKAIGASLEDLELNDLERRDNAMPCGFWAMVNKISEYQYLDYVTYFSVFCGDWSKPLITILGNNHPLTGYVGVPVVLIARSIHIYIYIMYILYDSYSILYGMKYNLYIHIYSYIYIYLYTIVYKIVQECNAHTIYVTDGPRTATPWACAMLSPISLKGGSLWSKFTTVK